MPPTVLTEEMVRQARRIHRWKQQQVRRLEARYSIPALARLFGCSVNAMDRAIRGETWKEVEDQ